MLKSKKRHGDGVCPRLVMSATVTCPESSLPNHSPLRKLTELTAGRHTGLTVSSADGVVLHIPVGLSQSVPHIIYKDHAPRVTLQFSLLRKGRNIWKTDVVLNQYLLILLQQRAEISN